MDDGEFYQLSHQELISLARRLNAQVHERLTFEQARRVILQTEIK
jgi:hypothetical protein